MPVTRNFGPLDQIKLTDKALMREVGLMVRERIVRRTRQGIGVDGAFVPYSAGYARRKMEALGGSSRIRGVGKGKQIGKFLEDGSTRWHAAGALADLTVSGAMLNAIVLTRVDDDEVELGFSS